MKMLRTLFLTGSVLIMLCACGEQKEPAAQDADTVPPASSNQDEQAPADQPTETVVDGDDTNEEMTVIKDTDGLPLLTASITRPNVSGLVVGAAKKSIDRYYDDLYQQEQEWWKEDLVDFARENKKAVANYGGDFLPYTVGGINQIIYNGDTFLSIRRDLSTYTGGAHGSTAISCDNFRKSDGSPVHLSELFREDNYKELLVQNIKEQIESMQENPDNEAFFSGDWPDALESTFDEAHFLIGSEALTIVYQEYDIAPYAAGPQLFQIDYADISNELSETFLRDIYGGKE